MKSAMFEFKNIENIDTDLLTAFVVNHEYGNIFQTSDYYYVHKNQQGTTPFGFAVTENQQIAGIVIGVIYENYFPPVNLFTRRAVIMGGPLVLSGRNDILEFMLINLISQLRKKCIYVQLRNLSDTAQFRQIFEKSGFIYEDHLDIIHNLNKPAEEIKLKISKNKRGNVNKSRNKGAFVREITDLSEFRKGLNLIRRTYKRVGLPLPDDNYFIHAHRQLSDNEILKTFGAFYQDVLIGVRMELCYNGMIYDWYAGADENYKSLYPNDLLPYSILMWGHENGFYTFDFGGAGKPDVPYGVREHKLKFGGELVNYGRYELVNQKLVMSFSKLAFWLLKKIKSNR